MVYMLELLHRYTEEQRIKIRSNGSFGNSRCECYCTWMKAVLTLEEGYAFSHSYYTSQRLVYCRSYTSGYDYLFSDVLIIQFC